MLLVQELDRDRRRRREDGFDDVDFDDEDDYDEDETGDEDAEGAREAIQQHENSLAKL